MSAKFYENEIAFQLELRTTLYLQLSELTTTKI